MDQGSVVAISIASEHEGSMTSVEQARAVAGKGLEGDRYFGVDPDTDVTLIEAEAIDAVEPATGYKLGYAEARRNVVVRGLPLNELIDCEIAIGDVTVRATRLSQPCEHLASLTDQRILKGLAHKGGLKCAILNDGVIRVGDPVRVTVRA
jgi:MOSC domain-containing protein YiiM